MMRHTLVIAAIATVICATTPLVSRTVGAAGRHSRTAPGDELAFPFPMAEIGPTEESGQGAVDSQNTGDAKDGRPDLSSKANAPTKNSADDSAPVPQPSFDAERTSEGVEQDNSNAELPR